MGFILPVFIEDWRFMWRAIMTNRSIAPLTEMLRLENSKLFFTDGAMGMNVPLDRDDELMKIEFGHNIVKKLNKEKIKLI